ncbi:MAG: glycoside hydrolase family 3 N-terminal domain-containing protein [Bacteroidota bacterium]
MKEQLLFFCLFLILFSCDNSSSKQVSSDSSEERIEQKVDSVLAKMSLDEKIGQLALRGRSSRGTDQLPEELLESVRNGEIGAFLNVMDTSHMRQLQYAARYESKNGIPLLFARDVIHGFKTIFPIPLGQTASWNPEMVKRGNEIAAMEASSVGIRWTFAPMLDICRDSRWGRIAESPGEDPYLASVMAKAAVEGLQGDDLTDPTHMAACAKHFLGYGAAIGGRDYNTAIMSEEQLYNIYLPPFKAAIESNAATVMSTFNEINGMPVTADPRILTDILRYELDFDGFVVSDWNSIYEMISHGVAADLKEAANKAAKAGVDMEMTSTAYDEYLKELVEEGTVQEKQLDFLVRNILRTKFRLGLFDQPFIPKDHPGKLYAEESMEAAKEAAIESSVLLKNEGILPISKGQKILLTGPLANQGKDQLGTWTFDGVGDPSITPAEAFEEATFIEGLAYSRDKDLAQLSKVVAAARSSDVILFVGGEEAILSGEAHSRANIRLPGVQETYIKELAKTGKPIVLVLFSGRPNNITDLLEYVDAVLMMWHPGTMGGPALRDMVYGTAEPSGRLPVSWPKMAGQLPYYYNHKPTGRPANEKTFVGIDDIPVGAWQSSLGNESHYLDAGFTPLFPFGFGLSYSTFSYKDLKLSKETLKEGEEVEVSISLTNDGNYDAQEVVQLYIRDKAGRITRPVRALKGFQKVKLQAGEQEKVTFTLHYDDFKYYDNYGIWDVEAGEIEIYVGSNSTTKNRIKLILE